MFNRLILYCCIEVHLVGVPVPTTQVLYCCRCPCLAGAVVGPKNTGQTCYGGSPDPRDCGHHQKGNGTVPSNISPPRSESVSNSASLLVCLLFLMIVFLLK